MSPLSHACLQCRWLRAYIASIYTVFAFIISLSWMKGDEWIFLMMEKGSYSEVLHTCINRWLHANGRLGDIVGSVLGLSESRWQQIFITPFFIVTAPFAVYMLVRKSGENQLVNIRGCFFVLFFVTILAISVNTTPWRNYYDYAASINYLWPCTIICYFISYYRSDLWTAEIDSKSRVCWLMVLGVYSGWSLECLTLFMLPALLLWLFYRWRNKLYIPKSCFAGICGVIVGSFFLTSSPGLSVRGMGELVNKSIDVSSLSFSEAFDFVCNHSVENMQQIKGVTVDFYLKGLPMILRPFYLPELFTRFVSCCYPLIICFSILLFMGYKTKGLEKEIRVSLILLALSIICVMSYLYGCVPRKMSYFPSIFILAVACSYLYLNLFRRCAIICILLSVSSVIAFSCIMYPSVVEAWEYKHYQQGLRELMYNNMKKGVKDAHIPPVTYTKSPQNKLGLITDVHHLW